MKKGIEKYYSRILLMGLFVFLIHGSKLHSVVVGIDTEDLIHLGDKFYGGWLYTGRQGLVFLKLLMGQLEFHPHTAGLLTLLMLTLAVVSGLMLWEMVLADAGCTGSEKRQCRTLAWVVGGLFMIAHPVMAEQLYFTLQSAELSIAICLVHLVLYLLYRNPRVWKYILSVLLLVIVFAVYQAMIPYFIFGVTAVLFMRSLQMLSEKPEVKAGKLFSQIVPYAGIFLGGFVINTLINRLFFNQSSGYLEAQILWGKYPLIDNFRAIYHHMKAVLLGRGTVHFSLSFGVLCLLTVLYVLFVLLRKIKGNVGGKLCVLFYLASMMITPFLMTFVCGGAPVVRSMLVLPALTGLLGYLCVRWCAGVAEVPCVEKDVVGNDDRNSAGNNGKKIGRVGCSPVCKVSCKVFIIGVAVTCLAGIWKEIGTTLSLHYTEQMSYEQDAYLGREMISRIEQAIAESPGANMVELPVVILGNRPFQGNNATLTGEIIGSSFFNHDVTVEPTYYWSSRRILGFLHTLGADYNMVSKDGLATAKEIAKDMPLWPADGSVQVRENMVIIKLSDTITE